MELRQIAINTVTLELTPDDCARLAVACEVAGICYDGGSSPGDSTRARLHRDGTTEGEYAALAVALEAAGMAAETLNNVAYPLADTLTLTTFRAGSPAWHGQPDTGAGKGDGEHER